VNTLDFLRAVWSDNGVYCLAVPRDDGSWRHLKYDTIEEAAAAASKLCHSADVYFATHSLRAKQVPHSEPAKAAAGKTQVRVRRNMLEARTFFFDLDVGDREDKYATREEAMLSLKNFIAKSELPWPMVVSSGRGFHVYWRLTDAIPSEEWREPATQLRQLAFHYGMKPDKSRTTDTSSVLRVAGTFHRKDPNNILPVDVMKPGSVTPTGVFLKLLADALIRQGIEPQHATKLAPVDKTGLGSNLSFEYDGPNPKITSLFTACAQMQRIGHMGGKFSEPEWYSLAIGVTRFTENANRNIHKLSKGHPGYSEAACNAKIRQSETHQSGPTICSVVEEKSRAGDTLCLGCPFQGRVTSPIQAALLIRLRRHSPMHLSRSSGSRMAAGSRSRRRTPTATSRSPRFTTMISTLSVASPTGRPGPSSSSGTWGCHGARPRTSHSTRRCFTIPASLPSPSPTRVSTPPKVTSLTCRNIWSLISQSCRSSPTPILRPTTLGGPRTMPPSSCPIGCC